MNKAALDARNEYRRKWAKANPDKIRAQQERYWERKAAAAASAAGTTNAPEPAAKA